LIRAITVTLQTKKKEERSLAITDIHDLTFRNPPTYKTEDKGKTASTFREWGLAKSLGSLEPFDYDLFQARFKLSQSF